MPGKPEKRLKRELERLQKDPPPGCRASLISDKNLFEWEAWIEGPESSSYEGGIYRLTLTFPKNYPIKPPNVLCKTKIYHCNINDSGQICLDILKGQWSPVLTISKILLSFQSLLTDPNPDDPLVPDVAKIYRKSKIEHDRIAREWNLKYAMNMDNKNKKSSKKKKKRK